MNDATTGMYDGHDRREERHMEDGACHILTFSDTAMDLGQSVNYIIGDDIALHILVQPAQAAIILNTCIAGQWQTQSLVPLPAPAEGGPLRVALLFRGDEVLVAPIGSRTAKPVARGTTLVGKTARISRGETIGLQVLEAPAAMPGPGGVLDFCGQLHGSTVVISGWTSQVWPEATEPPMVVLTAGGAQHRLPATVWWYHRPDLGETGTGYILSFCPPPAIDIDMTALSQLEVITDDWAHALRPHAKTLLLDTAPALEWLTGVLPLIRTGDVATLRGLISRQVYAGHDTMATLGLPCHFEVDASYLAPGQGLMLVGWMLDPMDGVQAIRICAGREEMATDLRAHMLRTPRPDVRDAFAQTYDLTDPRIGYVAHAPLRITPGAPLHARIEMKSGAIGFKPLAPARPAGVPALHRLLQEVQLSGHELQAAFDTTLGAPLIAINAARLSRPMAVEEVRFGTPPAEPRCSIIVPLYGRLDFVEYQCALFSRGGIEADELIYVLDQPERKAELLELAELCHAKFGVPLRVILPAENRGFGPASNLGLAHARGAQVCFLNSDIFPESSDWLDGLIATLQSDPAIGAVGALCLFADGSIQHAGMGYRNLPRMAGWQFPEHPGKGMRPAAQPPHRQDMPAITGACMVMTRALAIALDGFDSAYVIGDFEDADLCNRIIAQGLRCVLDSSVRLRHLERQSQGDQSSNWRKNLTLLNAWTFNGRWAATSAPKDH